MFVYFIAGTTERKRGKDYLNVKIGWSRHPEERMKELQVGSPVKLKFLGTAKCANESHARRVEKMAHRMFKYHRSHGEWFRLPQQQVGHIKNVLKELRDMGQDKFRLIRNGENVAHPIFEKSPDEEHLDREYREIMRGV